MGRILSASRREQVNSWFPEEGKTEAPMHPLPQLRALRPLQSHDLGLDQCPTTHGVIPSLKSFLLSDLCSRAVVHIQVKDVNEFAPTFKEPAYKAIVTEGKIYDSILQVEAIDEDCSPQYSQICNYEIVTTDVPFAIDRNGECPGKDSSTVRKTNSLPRSRGQERPHRYLTVVPPLKPFI